MISLDQIDIQPITGKDAWNLCNFAVVNEFRMKRYFPITLEQNLTPDLSKRFAEVKSKEFALNEEYLFTVKPKDGKSIVALVYIKELDWDKRQGEFAYCVDYNWEGKGITTEVVKVLSDHAFKELGLEVLQIIVHKENTASVRVAEKCNFSWQRTLEKVYTPPGEPPLDMELYELYK